MRIENGISAQLCHLLVKEEQDVRRIYRKKNIVIVVTRQNLSYSKHPHIRTLILEVRLIRFLYIGCLVKNQPEGVLKLFLKIGGGNQNCNKYTKKSLRLN